MKSNSLCGGSNESDVLPQIGLVQNSQKTVECDLKRKRINRLWESPLNDTFANNEDQDEKLYNAVYHQGLHCLLRIKKDFQTKIHFLNYNLTPLDLYNGQSLVYCIKRERRIH